MQRYIGYTLRNKFTNFGFNIENNSIQQFSYYKDGKQLMISNLRSLFQNQGYVQMFLNWREKIENLVSFILSLQELQEESSFIKRLKDLKQEIVTHYDNLKEIIYKRKKYYIESLGFQLIMRHFIDTGSLILILQNKLTIYIKLVQQKFVECAVCLPVNLKNESGFKLNNVCIRIIENGQVNFGFYKQSIENGIFKQFKLINKSGIDQIVNGQLRDQLQFICSKVLFCHGQMLRDDQSNMQFNECFDHNIISNFKYHYLYANIDEQFKLIIDLIIKNSSQQKIYQKNGIYYKGLWQDGKFDGIGIKINQNINKYYLGTFNNNQQTDQGVIITILAEIIIEFSQFQYDKMCDICKIQEVTSNENIIRFVDTQQGGNKSQKSQINPDIDNKLLFNQPFGEDKKDLQRKYQEFNEILKQEGIIFNRQYQNQDIYNSEDGQIQQFLTRENYQQFGRSLKMNPFEIYEGMIQNNKKKGYGQIMIIDDGFQLLIGTFDQDDLQQVFVKINLIYDMTKQLYYQPTQHYLYNISEINQISIEPEYKKLFIYTNQIEFQLTNEMSQILSSSKPILRIPENDLIFLKTLNMNEIFKNRSDHYYFKGKQNQMKKQQALQQ
ncbi:hypothetical protein pb186bvf_019947 [Paramecium bursaria]